MASYQKVLAAVDLSAESESIIKRAMAVVPESAQLTVLHVVESFESLYVGDDWFGGGLNAIELQENIEQQRREHLEKLLASLKLSKEAGVVLSGSPAAEIRNYAQEVEADLVVVGTHGRHGLELLLGSISNGVLHGTPCDVLAVKV